jgi:hypothetical protein
MTATIATPKLLSLKYDEKSQVILLEGLPRSLLEQLSFLSVSQTDWQSTFPIQLSQSPNEGCSMAGTYQLRTDGVAFLPRYPFQAGQSYQAIFYPDVLRQFLEQKGGNTGVLNILKKPIAQDFEIPQPQGQQSQVLQIYPTSNCLPENLLRFYIYFSSPMRRGDALQQVHLLDERGHIIPGVFLETGEELWNPTSTRLTVLLDPGRVKTGLRAHSQLGRALTAGESYQLMINPEWQNAQGQPLQTSFSKEFVVMPEFGTHPAIATWQQQPPQAGTRDPLQLRFPFPLDHISLLTRIQVLDEAEVPVPGKANILDDETLWQWTPDNPWTEKIYTIKVDPQLEDIAGNTLFGLFDQPSHRDRFLRPLPPTTLQISPHPLNRIA